ncbi:MAG TPA: biosynthetic peptidoglycan transglycosylase [Candidatus Edwardsbacteria bacterium]|nr:biosynthetic peptidoglycan transglycosylase [Candidatus Edwardsbacteria bacterium]
MKRNLILAAACALQVFFLWTLGSVAWDLTHLPGIGDLRQHNPAVTSLMQQRAAEAAAKQRAFHPYQVYVPYGAISADLKHAVLIAEDDVFFSHGGVDYGEIREAIRTDWRKKRWAYGGSTITMQLAKNLFLSTRKRLTRKVSEYFLALRLDGALPKARILELYLNYIEWGDGIFGCEAASRAYFGCPAADLSPEQAIRLASIIVNPRRYGPFTDTKRMLNRRKMIADRMVIAKYLTPAQRDSLPF